MIKTFVITLIKTYQIIKSFFGFSCCRFYPTCSHYALDAVKKYGVLQGTGMALMRIFRCSPLSAGGHDPVR